MSQPPGVPTTPAVPVHVDSDGRLATDHPCLNCGYNLRGLEMDETCPECGAAVRTSLRRDRLAEAPQAWLRQLQRGAGLARLGVALTPLLVGLPVATVGLWMLTAPQPGREEPARDERFRWSGRTLLAAGAAVLLALAGWLGWLLATRPRELLTTAPGSADVVGIAGAGLFVLGFLAVTVHLESFALRIPHEAMLARVRHTQRHWLAGIGAMLLLAVAAQVINRLYLSATLPYWPWVTAAFSAAVAVVLLWLWVATLRLFGAVGRSLRGVGA